MNRVTLSMVIALTLFAPAASPATAACGTLGADSGTVSGAATTAASVFQDTGASASVNLGSFTGDVIAIASFSSDSSANAMTGSWRLTDDSTNSIPIDRYITSNGDKGIGTVVHIFQSVTGSKTFKLQHRTDTSGRNAITTGTIVAIPLITDGGVSLNNAVVTTTANFATTSTSFQAVPNTTATVSLPVRGDIYVATSFNSSSGVGQSTTGEWKLQFRPQSGTWNDLGRSSQRRHSGANDTGAVSLTAIAKDQAAGTYEFRLAVAAPDGRNINTFNVTLATAALAYDNAGSQGYFPAFQVDSASASISSANTREIALETNKDVSSDSAAQVFLGSQYQMGGITGSTTMTFDVAVDSGSTFASLDQPRLLSNSGDIGNGGSVGLSGSLSASSNHDLQLRFEADRTPAALTNPVLVGIGMTCRSSYSPTAITLRELSARSSPGNWPVAVVAISLLAFSLFTCRSWLVCRQRVDPKGF